MKVIQIREEEGLGFTDSGGSAEAVISGDTISGMPSPDNVIGTDSADYSSPSDNLLNQPAFRHDPPPPPPVHEPPHWNRQSFREPSPPPLPINGYNTWSVPYYIPVGINPYREPYNISFRNRKYSSSETSLSNREGNYYEFTDGTPGKKMKKKGIVIKAGSKFGDYDFVEINLGRLGKYYRKFKRAKSAKEIYFRLIDVLEENPDFLIELLIRYKFKRKEREL